LQDSLCEIDNQLKICDLQQNNYNQTISLPYALQVLTFSFQAMKFSPSYNFQILKGQEIQALHD